MHFGMLRECQAYCIVFGIDPLETTEAFEPFVLGDNMMQWQWSPFEHHERSEPKCTYPAIIGIMNNSIDASHRGRVTNL